MCILPIDKIAVHQSILSVDFLQGRVKLGTRHVTCCCWAQTGFDQLLGGTALLAKGSPYVLD